MYKQDSVVNNLQGLICHKTQPPNQYRGSIGVVVLMFHWSITSSTANMTSSRLVHGNFSAPPPPHIDLEVGTKFYLILLGNTFIKLLLVIQIFLFFSLKMKKRKKKRKKERNSSLSNLSKNNGEYDSEIFAHRSCNSSNDVLG